MYLRSLLATACVATFAFAATASAAPDPAAGDPAPEQDTRTPETQPQAEDTGTPSTAAASESESLRLISAREIAGRDVVDQNGEPLGTAEYVTVDLDEGALSHLVIASQKSDAESDLVIVPWSEVQAPSDGGEETDQAENEQITLEADRQKVASGPRLKQSELAKLTRPEVSSYVIEYWNGQSEFAAFQREQSDQSQGETAASDSQEQQEQQDQQDQEARPLILVDSEIVTTVLAPMFQVSEDMTGATVNDQQGNEIGEITELIVDRDDGAVAYAVIEGRGDQIDGTVPAPLQALTWTPEDNTFLLTADPATLQENEALTDIDEEGGSIPRDQIAELYRTFDAEPYWETTQ